MNSRPAAEQVLGLLNFWWLLLELPPKSLFENWLWHSNFAQSYQKSLSFQINESKLIWYSIGVDYYLSITCKISSWSWRIYGLIFEFCSRQSVTASRRATLAFFFFSDAKTDFSPISLFSSISHELRSKESLTSYKKNWLSKSLSKKKWVEHGQFN